RAPRRPCPVRLVTRTPVHQFRRTTHKRPARSCPARLVTRTPVHQFRRTTQKPRTVVSGATGYPDDGPPVPPDNPRAPRRSCPVRLGTRTTHRPTGLMSIIPFGRRPG